MARLFPRAWLPVGLLLFAPSIASADVLEWNQLPPLPDPVGFAGPFAGTSNGALLVAGGANFPDGRPWEGAQKIWHDRIFVLDSPDGEWILAEQRLPRPLAYGVSLTLPGAAGGVLCLGGSDAERCYADVFILRWNGSNVEIVDAPALPEPLANSCGALVGSTVYLAGGLTAPAATSPETNFWSLDTSNLAADPEWQTLDPWPGPARMLSVAGSQQGAFYLFAGVDLTVNGDGPPSRIYLKDAYRYEPGGGWSELASLPRAATAAPSPAPALGDSHLLVLGGDDGEFATQINELKDDHPGFPADILAYHAITDTWSTFGDVPRTEAEGPAGVTWPPVTVPVVDWNGTYVVPSGEVRPGVRTPRLLVARSIHREAGWRMIDGVVVIIYLALIVGIGSLFSKQKEGTSEYFLGGRRIPWWAAGLSIFGTQLSAITFVSIPALAFRSDWLYALGNMMIVAIAPIVVYLYLPFFRRLNVTTAYEYLELRFNAATRFLGSASFILFQLGRMGVVVYLPSLALSTVTGVNVYVCIGAIGLLATLYTVLGGIEAVIWTDVLQVIVLLGGAIACLVLMAFRLDGGFSAMVSDGMAAGKLRMVDTSWDAAKAVLWVVVLGRFLEQFFAYTADQNVVQRYLTTSSEKNAARSIWTNAFLTIPSTAIFFALGTALWAFYRQHPELLNPAGKGDDIFPWFIAQQLPPGVSGLVIAALFAASMSSLDSSMNSMATALTTDFYRRFRPEVGDRSCLQFARIATLVLGLFGTGCAAAMTLSTDTGMWDTYTRIVGLFGGGLAGLFAAGIFTRRTTGTGAIIGFLGSAVVLSYVMSLERVHLILYPGIGMLSCLAISWLASLVTPGRAHVEGLTYHTLAPRSADG